MTFLLDTEELPEMIDEACDRLEDWGSGLVVNHIVEEARYAAEEIRHLDGTRDMDVQTLEAAQTALRLAAFGTDTRTDEQPDFRKHADRLGSAIWGRAPKHDTSSVGPS